MLNQHSEAELHQRKAPRTQSPFAAGDGQYQGSESMGSLPSSHRNQNIYKQTQAQAIDANQMTKIPTAHFRGIHQFFNQAALNEESFLH